ncbi:uncharacterized protein LOC113759640 [Coffea eugenioides]|uniref:uncharacterized protein LOC113759640 n=1 Tax=Coffea eugenioides TaxID=49369 RepID=UPI000F615AD4|nr:uncharacterized protein LOC113759640 [Coffea eugenioides]
MKSEIAELYFRDKANTWFHGVFSGGSSIPCPELSVAMSERFGEGTQKKPLKKHIITTKEVRADPKKIESPMQWPRPENVRQLKGFLGLTSYYRKFVKSYGAIAKTLTVLLRKDSFKWGIDAEEAFEKFKLAMCSTPIIALPDFTQQFVIETYACYRGL